MPIRDTDALVEKPRLDRLVQEIANEILLMHFGSAFQRTCSTAAAQIAGRFAAFHRSILPPTTSADFQSEVDRWMDACFGEPIKSDLLERADRFTEEALELVQTMPSFTAERAHALVDYVFGRPTGERPQEVGGVMVTLAALCNPVGIDIDVEAQREVARIWTKVEQIRAKQAAKPVGSALPVATSAGDGELVERLRAAFLPAILHGDEAHRAWLAAAVDAFIAGDPIPAPTGLGSKEALTARVKELEEALTTTRQLVADCAPSGFTDHDAVMMLYENNAALTATLNASPTVPGEPK
jgi:hypothetical protein